MVVGQSDEDTDVREPPDGLLTTRENHSSPTGTRRTTTWPLENWS